MRLRAGRPISFPIPQAETQYLHYNNDTKQLRYATDIGKDELLDHDGDVAISVALSQYRPAGNGEANMRARRNCAWIPRRFIRT